VSAELRVAVISDIHGNSLALRAVLDDIDRRGEYERIVMAGDFCLNGPDPADALDLAIERGDDLIKGNTDRDLVNEGADDPDLGERKRRSIAWCREQLGEARIQLLDRLVFDVRIVAPDDSTLLIVHANPRDLDRLIFPEMPPADLADLFEGCDADVVAFGHLHTPFVMRYGARQLFNIASCGASRDGDRRAVWGEFTWRPGTGWQGETHRVAYDYGDEVLRIIESGMPNTNRRIRELLSARYV